VSSAVGAAVAPVVVAVAVVVAPVAVAVVVGAERLSLHRP
jgi:hypothetical protein